MTKADKAIELVENATSLSQEELLTLAQRDNNNKRKFLLINKKQGKHLPVDPVEALRLFGLLGQRVRSIYQHQRVVVIGFAETATAIGAAVAAQFGPETLLLQTSREELSGVRNLVDFEEEHSHATSQKLYCAAQGLAALGEAEVILFVEDEVTTGKTICNFIAVLQQSGALRKDVRFAVASLVNGLSEDLMAQYTSSGIAYHYLLRGCYHADLDPYPHLTGLAPWQPEASGRAPLAVWPLAGKVEARSGVVVQAYEAACLALGQSVCAMLSQRPKPLAGEVLVLGTEEFMYPAMQTAKLIAERFDQCAVKVHATTRSPIKISGQAGYPIFNGSRLGSLYEKERTTYLYDLKPYDHVIWLTDASDFQAEGAEQLQQALQHFGCGDIMGIRWEAI